jgi:hypothetical protein
MHTFRAVRLHPSHVANQYQAYEEKINIQNVENVCTGTGTQN